MSTVPRTSTIGSLEMITAMVPSFAADTHLVVQAIGAIAASWCFLHLVRRFTQTSPLDKIPGPPSPSYFLGTVACISVAGILKTRANSGNLDEFFCHDSWDFHTRLIQDYGSIVKLHGLFNVSATRVTCNPNLNNQIVPEGTTSVCLRPSRAATTARTRCRVIRAG